MGSAVGDPTTIPWSGTTGPDATVGANVEHALRGRYIGVATVDAIGPGHIWRSIIGLVGGRVNQCTKPIGVA